MVVPHRGDNDIALNLFAASEKSAGLVFIEVQPFRSVYQDQFKIGRRVGSVISVQSDE